MTDHVANQLPEIVKRTNYVPLLGQTMIYVTPFVSQILPDATGTMSTIQTTPLDISNSLSLKNQGLSISANTMRNQLESTHFPTVTKLSEFSQSSVSKGNNLKNLHISDILSTCCLKNQLWMIFEIFSIRF